MSLTPIFSLARKRSELGKATKGQIYLSKIAIGALVAGAFWLVSLGTMEVVFWGSAGVFATSKICYYVDTKDWVSFAALSGWPLTRMEARAAVRCQL